MTDIINFGESKARPKAAAQSCIEPETIFEAIYDEIWGAPSPAYVQAVAACLDKVMACPAPAEYGGSDLDASVLLQELMRYGFRVVPIQVGPDGGNYAENICAVG